MKKLPYCKIYILFLGLLLASTLRPDINPILLQVSGEPNNALHPGYIATIGSDGTGDGEFDRPFGITIGETHIFVADTYNHRIQIFDRSGNFVTKFGSYGSGDGQFNHTYGIAVNDNHIFVTDGMNNRVQIFDFAGNFISKFGSYG
ncbi:MAG: 6-bladed beta-propeller, partial [Candidatus Kariarchaeaceae archaeon]